MDRINGADTIDIGGGRRGFIDEDLGVGQAGTEVTALWLNMIQEEVAAVIEAEGLVLSPGDWTQLLQAIRARDLARSAWRPVLSVSQTAPPGAPVRGDTYVIPAGATGAWAGQAQKLAEWSGTAWTFTVQKEGHGVSIPDGRVYLKVSGVYVEKLAQDSQSGKWNYGDAGGTANALTLTLAPVPISYAALTGAPIRVKTGAAANTGAMTINVNGLGAKDITSIDGSAMGPGQVPAGSILLLVYDGVKFQRLQEYSAANRLAAPAPSGLAVAIDVQATSGLFEAMVGHLASNSGTVQCGVDISFDSGSTWTALYQDNNVAPGENALLVISVRAGTYRALMMQTNSTAVNRAAGNTGTVTGIRIRARAASGAVSYSEFWIRKAG